MTGATMTEVLCSSCGNQIAKVSGVQVYTDLICTNPICEYQGSVELYEQRDAIINYLLEAPTAAARVAKFAGLSRQRIYQIRKTWLEGV